VSQILPSREELLADVRETISDPREAEWMVDHVLLPAFREYVAKRCAELLTRFRPHDERPH
jgi:hypothetical protein